MRRDLALCLFIAVCTAVVYGQTVGHEFVNYDDGKYVYENVHVRNGLSWEGVGWAFTTLWASNWHPLTWLSHMLDCELFGLNAGVHHLGNVLLHILNSMLLCLVLRNMTGAVWRSAMVAALFALHPLHVESVAWVAERKDVLSTLFFMLTLGAYARYADRPSRTRYGLVFVFLALGLMAKPMLVTVPFVLLLLDYWPLERFRLTQTNALRLLVMEKVPLFVLVAASSLVTFVAQQRGGATSLTFVVPFGLRIANALVSYVAYPGKILWPTGLAVLYPYRDAVSTVQWAGAAAVLAGVTVLVIWASRKRRYPAVGWLWYLGTLVPVIGLVQVGMQSMADRYTYVPAMGLFVMAVWGMADLLARWRLGRVVHAAMAGVVIVACMIGTWFQVDCWANTVTLFEHALKVARPSALAHNNLGLAFAEQGKREKAIAHYQEALRIHPTYAKAHANLGVLLMEKGKSSEAIRHCTEAVRIDPQLAKGHLNLGFVLFRQGKDEEAIASYREALRIQPTYAKAHYNLGFSLARQGKADEAISHFHEALAVDPASPGAHRSLAMALDDKGEHEEAIGHYREAIRLDPEDPISHNNLAWLRATHSSPSFRNGAEAVALAERACDLLGTRDPHFLDTLAAAYAEAGRFPKAIETLEEAISLAASGGQEELVLELEQRLQGYMLEHPYRKARTHPEAARP